MATMRSWFRSAGFWIKGEIKGTYEELEHLFASTESLYEKDITVRMLYQTFGTSLLLGGYYGNLKAKEADLKEQERTYRLERKFVKMEFHITQRLTENDLQKALADQPLQKSQLHNLAEIKQLKQNEIKLTEKVDQLILAKSKNGFPTSNPSPRMSEELSESQEGFAWLSILDRSSDGVKRKALF